MTRDEIRLRILELATASFGETSVKKKKKARPKR
jgi:hypothetical protein